MGAPLYLSGCSGPLTRAYAAEHPDRLGLMLTPNNGYRLQTPFYRHIAVDNGAFGHPDFSESRWWRYVLTLPRTALFVVAPDVPFDAAGSIERGLRWVPWLRREGFRAAIAAQNGAEKLGIMDCDFDVLFIGGDDTYKTSNEARRLTFRAHQLGRTVHVGRVNTRKRYRGVVEIGADSCDGTMLRYARAHLSTLSAWHESLNSKSVTVRLPL